MSGNTIKHMPFTGATEEPHENAVWTPNLFILRPSDKFLSFEIHGFANSQALADDAARIFVKSDYVFQGPLYDAVVGQPAPALLPGETIEDYHKRVAWTIALAHDDFFAKAVDTK